MSLHSYESPLGMMLMETHGDALVGLWFMGQKHFPERLKSMEFSACDSVASAEARLWLDDYFAGKRPHISRLKLIPQGTEFQRRVWDILLKIPYGETLSYGAAAKLLEAESGRRMSAQAVGGAVGRNPISIIIPCHRVLGSDGSLTGYAGGADKKLALLRHEGIL